MVNTQKVHGLLRNLEKALEQLRIIGGIKREEYLGNAITIGAAKYYLQTAIEACIDIGNHLIAAQGYRSPKDYRDVFLILEENHVVTHPVGSQLRQMAGLRNRLVHLYWEIDDDMIFEYLQANLGDFDLYVHQIVGFLKQLD